MNSKIVIPYGKQDITQQDIEAVVNVLRSDFLTQGAVVPKFEQELCEYTRARYAVAVNSCTSALHIACLSLGLGPGDILWTSPITFVASANCALYCGAEVDFVDVEPDTALMSVEKLKQKLRIAEKSGKLPKIVIPVHFSGQPCDMKEIYNLGKQYGFKIIEDAAHAIGARYDDKPVGNCCYSDVTVFSFHPVKVITTGEGGVALTNNKELAQHMGLLRSHGITRDPSRMSQQSEGLWHYEQIVLGFNYRMTDIQAALGISQLHRLDEYVLRRNEISKWYDQQFQTTDINPLVEKDNRYSSKHLYVIKVENKGSNSTIRKEMYKTLKHAGIGVNVHYIPVYRHSFFNIKGKLSGAEEYYKDAISLPIFPTITKQELTLVVKTIEEVMGSDRKKLSL